MKQGKYLLLILLSTIPIMLTAQDTTNAVLFGYDNYRTFIQYNLRYPNPAVENGISGKVEFKFKINIDGCIEKDSVLIISSPDLILSLETQRVIREMECNWIPAKVNNKPIDIWVNSYIEFVLQGKKKKK